MSDPIFALVSTNPFGLSDVGSFSSPTFADIDSDGDQDAFVGNEAGNTLFFRNTGTASSSAFSLPETNPFGLTNAGARANPIFVDIDNDGDLDAFVGNAAGNTQFFRNMGTANSPVFAAPETNPFGLSDVGNNASPTFVDIDGDGDQDAYIGNYLGNTLFFKNTGTISSPVFAFPGNSNLGGAYYAHPTFVDIDGDGDFDSFMGSVSYDFYGHTGISKSESKVSFSRNTGTASNPVFVGSEADPFGMNNVGTYATVPL